VSSASPKRRLATAELVERLNAMIDQLIAENRRLRRQIDKRTGVATGKVERGLKTMKRRVEKALTTKRAKRRPPAKPAAKRTAKRPVKRAVKSKPKKKTR
jgi:hypothetical protein